MGQRKGGREEKKKSDEKRGRRKIEKGAQHIQEG